ncbi:MAG: EAL domain-containing protein [Luteimonas sp.]
MNKRLELALASAGVLLALALPVIASLYIAHRHSVDEESANAAAAATEVLRRADILGAETDDAYARLKADVSPPCSAAHIKLMRAIDMSSVYLQATGYVIGNKFACSSLGASAEGTDLGPVSYVTKEKVRVRTAVDLGLHNGPRFLVVEYDGYATAILPDYLIDFGTTGQDIAFGVYSASSGALLSKRGTFKPEWRVKLGSAMQTMFYDQSFLVVLKRSSHYNVVAYAAIPSSKLEANIRSALILLLPMALGLGAITAAGAFWLLRQQSSLPSVLRGALRRGEFSLHYQPIVALDDRRTVGVEALIRWDRKKQEALTPDVFIPIAEACGLIQKITSFVIEQLTIDLPRIARAMPGCYVSLNLSALDLRSCEIIKLLSDLLDKTNFEPSALIVEATEYSLIGEAHSRDIVKAIREVGILVAIDDFGTGYSNLSYLTQMQCDILKIDRTFVDTVGIEAVTSDVALHILQIAHALSMKVIAEGVETEVQAEFLCRNGAVYAQGWLFAKALPLNELIGPPEPSEDPFYLGTK